MILVLVRHGEVDYSFSRDPHLTENGEKQCIALSERVRSIPFKAFFSSTLQRSIQTADFISKEIGLKPLPTESLNEISSYFVDGSQNEFERLDSFFDQLNFAENEFVLCVVHGHVIRYIVSKIIGCSFEDAQKIDIYPASITIVKQSSKRGKTITVNNYEHIPKELRTKKEQNPKND